MENEKEKINKNTIFNRALYITIPDDDNGNGGMLSNGLKSLGDSYNGDTPGKRFLTSSLLKKIEEGTPVTEKDIRIDLEKMKISNSFNNINNNNENNENNNLNDDFNNEKNNKVQKKSSFNNNKFIFDNKIDDKDSNYDNNNNNNNEYFKDNHFVVSEDEDTKKEDNEKKGEYNNNNNNYNNNIHNNIYNNNNNIIDNNNISNNNNQSNNETEIKKKDLRELKEEEYIFEKFGKRGWQCSKCNNFNFESRVKCNRCFEIKDPKTLEEIKKELEEKNSGDKKKKPLIERKGDWQCPKCHNLNFAFRQECNRCHLSKEVYLNYQNKIQQQGNNFGINLMNQPQIIQNQINLIQNFGFVPNMYNGIGRAIDNNINNKINSNINNKINNISNNNQNYNGNMNNNFYNWGLQKNSLQNNNYQMENFYNHNFN